MSPIQPPGLVLVTGANGYVASWVVHNLLHKGFSVRATVRSQSKGKHFAEQSWSKPFFDEGKLEVAVVEDITKEGAFDEAAKGVDAIEHTASPVTLAADDPQELIAPAVNGTLNLLQSALKNKSTIKRVVITGSCAAIVEILPHPKLFNESDWDEQAIQEVKEKGKDARPILKYRASKTLAEKGAWVWYEEHKSQIDWDLVVLNPPYVFGPTIQPVSTPKDLGASSAELHNTIFTPGYKSKEALHVSSSYVDVRDLGEAHVRALLRDGVGGERIIISSGKYTWQEWIDMANSLQPSLLPTHTDLHKGAPYNETEKPVYMLCYDGTKAGKLLHMGAWDAPEGVSDWYRMKEKEGIAKDVLSDCASRGW